ncbi:MAG: serine protease, partial [Myxococcota bacterium]
MTPSPWLVASVCFAIGAIVGSSAATAQDAARPSPPPPSTTDRSPEEEGVTPTPSNPPQEEPTPLVRFGVEVQWPLATRLYRRHKAAVVRLDTAGGVGTGFVYHSKRHIATAFHVVSAGRPITVALPEGGQRQAKVVAIDPAHDLAILEMDAPIEEVSPL